MSIKEECKDCKKEKELTIHGNCFRCHLKEININRIIPGGARKIDND